MHANATFNWTHILIISMYSEKTHILIISMYSEKTHILKKQEKIYISGKTREVNIIY